MEKSKYIIQDNPNSRQTRSTWQRENDMQALTCLTFLYTADGKIEKTRVKQMIDFFNGNKKLKQCPFSKDIQDSLIKIKNNWASVEKNGIIKTIHDYVKNRLDTTVSETNFDSMFKAFKTYYTSDRNFKYISVEKLLSDIANQKVDENQAVEEFEFFYQAVEKDAGLSTESEAE